MIETEFKDARRHMTNLLASTERRCLIWLAARMPAGINSDHLTVLALFAMLMAGVSYWAARANPLALLMAIGWLAANWFGDSLDGTLARVRGRQRPRYGFYVDHVVDCIGVSFLLAGLGASGFMSPMVAAILLVAYLLLSIEIYLATYSMAVFHMSFWGFGPTELRIVLAIGTVALLFDPRVEVLGASYRLFDVAGIVATVGLAITLAFSIARNVRALYRAEPLPEPLVQVS